MNWSPGWMNWEEGKGTLNFRDPGVHLLQAKQEGRQGELGLWLTQGTRGSVVGTCDSGSVLRWEIRGQYWTSVYLGHPNSEYDFLIPPFLHERLSTQSRTKELHNKNSGRHQGWVHTPDSRSQGFYILSLVLCLENPPERLIERNLTFGEVKAQIVHEAVWFNN